MALYNDRVYAYERMQQIDKQLDTNPDKESIRLFLNSDEANQLAFDELKHYNEHKRFLFVHPLLNRYKMQTQLERIRHSDPERFMRELVNANKSVTRYRSKLKNKRYKDAAEKQAWTDLIEKYNIKIELIKELLSE